MFIWLEFTKYAKVTANRKLWLVPALHDDTEHKQPCKYIKHKTQVELQENDQRLAGAMRPDTKCNYS